MRGGMNKPFTEHGRQLLKRLQAAGIDFEKDRWAGDGAHHPESEKLVRELADLDWMLGDYFGWKIGGDGDSGEILMYQLDILFELRDAEANDA